MYIKTTSVDIQYGLKKQQEANVISLAIFFNFFFDKQVSEFKEWHLCSSQLRGLINLTSSVHPTWLVALFGKEIIFIEEFHWAHDI